MKNQEMEAFVQAYFRGKNHAWLTGDPEHLFEWHRSHEDLIFREIPAHHKLCQARNMRTKKTSTDVAIVAFDWDEKRELATVEVAERIQWIYRDGANYEDEARIYRHVLEITPYHGNWQIIRCRTQVEGKHHSQSAEMIENSLGNGGSEDENQEFLKQNRTRKHLYDRMQVMKYAEKWWDRFNPGYRKFEVDCTNFVSQCIHAGRAPMVHMGNRSKGWWYQHGGGANDNWSYSWSVANSLRWFLGGNGHWHATIVEDPRELKIGDVICYDWDGDGHFTHNTVIVAFDVYNRPLVNAHTVESHRRYWEYRDSYAWTENTKYLFFQLPDQF
ncbi:amidase domain-containing protein [Fodinisporobacter ferrooxydans]|uniref:Amidase domain-containing protein n=1 Tax=Fodinisporobacter ferrooxydans TaxID=2901836 RepID=A0ABY4CMU2_9BACL|nr:amidase domain-containing protein [Alicyclobacillaceae bacterium MYW30-H2]